MGLCQRGYGEEAQDRDHWRLKINGEPANPCLPGKWPLKRCVCVRTRRGRHIDGVIGVFGPLCHYNFRLKLFIS